MPLVASYVSYQTQTTPYIANDR